MTQTLILSPNFSATKTHQAQTQSILFGDGYKQVTPSSLIPADVEWQIQANYLSATEAQSIDAQLSDLNGLPFLWGVSGQLMDVYICEKWEIVPLDSDVLSFSATFKRANNVVSVT